MTVKTVVFGGTDWVDGDVLFSADQNDTFGVASSIHRKRFSQLTELGCTSNTYQDVTNGSFTISALNGLILGINMSFQLKIASNTVDAVLKITGSNLGTKYIGANILYQDWDNVPLSLGAALLNTADGFRVKNTSYQTVSVSVAPCLKLLDATTTFQLQIKSLNDEQSYIDTMYVDVVYTKNYVED